MKLYLVDFNPHGNVSETEIIKRIAKVFFNLGHEIQIVDSQLKVISSFAETPIDKPDYIFHFHYSSSKVHDSKSVLVLWDPPEFIFHDTINTESILSHDYVVPVSNSSYRNFLDIFFQNRIEITKTALPPSCSSEYLIAPELKSTYRIFYSGINWEKVHNLPQRHGDLLKWMDPLDIVDIYGPNTVMGVQPWEGYVSYKGEIPFDGVSILKYANSCGVSLVISSKRHRVNGIPSSRIFEACASGNIIICEKNEFFYQNWGDSVLYFEYLSEKENFQQIVEHIKWINNNPNLAYAKAMESQNIFKSKMCLEVFLSDLVSELREISGARDY